jgi:membrane protease YdiL (CAAX protease family)
MAPQTRSHPDFPAHAPLSNGFTALVENLRRHPVVSYFVIAFAFSWAIWIPMAVINMRVYQATPWPTHFPAMLGPVVAALVMSAIVGGRMGVKDLLSRMVRWRVAGRWYLAALSPLAFFGIAAIAMAGSGRGWPDFGELGKFSGLPVVAAPVMWMLLLLIAYAEETGWRGFALPEMLKTKGFLTTAVVIGLFWFLWHVPTFFLIDQYRQMGAAILPMFILGMVSGSIFLAWLYRASGGSVFLVAVWHGTYNLVSGTAAAHGLVAAVVTTGVMAWAALIVMIELRRWSRVRRNPSGPHSESHRDRPLPSAGRSAGWSGGKSQPAQQLVGHPMSSTERSFPPSANCAADRSAERVADAASMLLVDVVKPPTSYSGWLMSFVVNPIVRALLYSPAHRLLSGNLLLLDYTGRRTGRRHVVPMGYAPANRAGDLVVVVGQHARKTWWRNFDATPQQVTVQLVGHPAQASARLLKFGMDEYAQRVRSYRAATPRARFESLAPLLILTPLTVTGARPAGAFPPTGIR